MNCSLENMIIEVGN